MNRYFVYSVIPRVKFEDCTLTLSEWMTRNDDKEVQQLKEKAAVEVIVQVSHSGLHIGGESPDIRVFYDFLSDSQAFLFRYNQNGTSLLVSSAPLPYFGKIVH